MASWPRAGIEQAYFIVVILGIAFMPARAGFPFSPRPCDLVLSGPLALISLTNYRHILLFAAFFVMTRAQFRQDDPYRLLKVALAGLAMGIAVELDQALVGSGHCRLRDLIPDGAGRLLGAAIMAFWDRAWGAKSADPG